MKMYFFTFRSITLAQRAEAALQKSGVKCKMRRTPRWMEEQGCGYGVEFAAAELKQGMEILRKAGIRHRRSYLLQPDGGVEAVHDLS